MDSYVCYVSECIKAFPELTASRLLREIRELGYGGGLNRPRRRGARNLPMIVELSYGVFDLSLNEGYSSPPLRVCVRRQNSFVEMFGDASRLPQGA